MDEDELTTSLLSHEHQRVVSRETCDDVNRKLIAVIVSVEGQRLQTSKVLKKQHDVDGELEATRNNHFRLPKESKHRVMASIELAYQELESLANNSYLDVEGDNDVASAVEDGCASNSPDTPMGARQLDKLTSNLRERLMCLSAELDAASTFLDTVPIKAENADVWMPKDLPSALQRLPTIPLPLTALSFPSDMAEQQRKPLLPFVTSSSVVKLPGVSVALALLSDKVLLLADLESGMSEVCSQSGRKLSRWLPPVFNVLHRTIHVEESVVAVLILSDGRAAVALAFKTAIVLLRRCKKASVDYMQCLTTHLTWTEYRRLDPVPFCPQIMSSHGDVLAAASPSEPKIQLLSIRCGRHLGRAIVTDYNIKSLAVCSNAVITGSRDKVEVDGGRRAYVIDAYSLRSHDQRLWHHELSSDEELRALCTDSMGCYLYAAVWASDRCCGLVASFSLTNFSELWRIVLSLDEAPRSPLVLSALSVWIDAAADQQPVEQQKGATVSRPMLLAVLYSDEKERVRSVVAMHRIDSSLNDC